jgi:hypothetical protein
MRGMAGLVGLAVGHDCPDHPGHLVRAMATLATRASFRASNARRRGSAVSGLCLARRIKEVAPITRSFLRYRSPILVIRPSRSLPRSSFAKVSAPARLRTLGPSAIDIRWILVNRVLDWGKGETNSRFSLMVEFQRPLKPPHFMKLRLTYFSRSAIFS